VGFKIYVDNIVVFFSSFLTFMVFLWGVKNAIKLLKTHLD